MTTLTLATMPTTDTVRCRNCGQHFEYEIGPGARPNHCSDDCRREYRAAYARARRAAAKTRPSSASCG